MDSNISNIIFDFAGYISKVFKILPIQCYNNNKNKIHRLDRYITKMKHDIVITSKTTKRISKFRNYTTYTVNNCILTKIENTRYNTSYTYYKIDIPLDLTNKNIIHDIMEIQDKTDYIKTYIDFTYLNRKVRGCIREYDIENNTINIAVIFLTL